MNAVPHPPGQAGVTRPLAARTVGNHEPHAAAIVAESMRLHGNGPRPTAREVEMQGMEQRCRIMRRIGCAVGVSPVAANARLAAAWRFILRGASVGAGKNERPRAEAKEQHDRFLIRRRIDHRVRRFDNRIADRLPGHGHGRADARPIAFAQDKIVLAAVGFFIDSIAGPSGVTARPRQIARQQPIQGGRQCGSGSTGFGHGPKRVGGPMRRVEQHRRRRLVFFRRPTALAAGKRQHGHHGYDDADSPTHVILSGSRFNFPVQSARHRSIGKCEFRGIKSLLAEIAG